MSRELQYVDVLRLFGETKPRASAYAFLPVLRRLWEDAHRWYVIDRLTRGK